MRTHRHALRSRDLLSGAAAAHLRLFEEVKRLTAIWTFGHISFNTVFDGELTLMAHKAWEYQLSRTSVVKIQSKSHPRDKGRGSRSIASGALPYDIVHIAGGGC